jgi:hypothetical protein
VNEAIKPTPKDQASFERVFGVLSSLTETELKAFLMCGVVSRTNGHEFAINPHLEPDLSAKVSAIADNPQKILDIASVIGINTFGNIKGLELNPVLAR